MAIVIPSKSDKVLSSTKDALRIMAWDTYKRDNNVSGIDGYAQFQTEWLHSEIHQMTLPKLEKFIGSLGYTTEELLETRKRYYERRKAYSIVESSEIPFDSLPH